MPRHEAFQGSLPLLVLKILSRRGPLDGYASRCGFTRRRKRCFGSKKDPSTRHFTGWKSGRIRPHGTITGSKRRARVYEITSQGRERLDEVERRWVAVNAAVLRALKHA